MVEKLTNDWETWAPIYPDIGGVHLTQDTVWSYPYPDMPVVYINVVYDSNLSSWVEWSTSASPDESGNEYPYDVGDWTAGSFSFRIRTRPIC